MLKQFNNAEIPVTAVTPSVLAACKKQTPFNFIPSLFDPVLVKNPAQKKMILL